MGRIPWSCSRRQFSVPNPGPGCWELNSGTLQARLVLAQLLRGTITRRGQRAWATAGGFLAQLRALSLLSFKCQPQAVRARTRRPSTKGQVQPQALGAAAGGYCHLGRDGGYRLWGAGAVENRTGRRNLPAATSDKQLAGGFAFEIWKRANRFSGARRWSLSREKPGVPSDSAHSDPHPSRVR